MTVPIPTPIFRFIHVDNLSVCLRRRALHAPNYMPKNRLLYRAIHNIEIQQLRQVTTIPCGSGGVIHDYVSFYFGPRSPMLYQLHTGRIADYQGGQEPLIYLISTAQSIHQGGTPFVFSDGHGIAFYTSWYDDLADLGRLDWNTIYATAWNDTVDDMDRQRRKQAEFLVHRRCDFQFIKKIAVINTRIKSSVERILGSFPLSLRPMVIIKPEWYY
ncbi:MAG: DUF4433 domain-containing protein [Candidatus Aminicenantales bacterium]